MKSKLPVLPVLIVAGICAAAGVLFGAPQDPPPQFRTGIDLTQLQVTVLHKVTRKPLTGLKAEDFVIEVGGAAQRIATLAEVSAPGTHALTAAGFAEAAHDVARNDGSRPRLFVIVMNDAAGGNDPYDRHTGMRIAHRIVDGLGPDDRAAVVFARDNRNAQDFTADRVLLRRAIDRFNPMRTIGINDFAVLQRAQEFLVSMPGYRRALIFISPLTYPDRGAEATRDVDRNVRALASGAGIGHVPIYLFSTHGLHAPTAEDMRTGGGRNSRYDAYLEILRTVANLTGGRAIAANNAPAALVPAVFDELRSYYLLAYEATHPPDGRYRWLQVHVKHPDALVMPSRVLVASTPAPAEGRPGLLNAARDSGLMEAIAGPLPAGDLPLRLSSVPLAVSNAQEQAVALTLALPPVERGIAEEFRVRLMLFDGEGRRELVSRVHDVKIEGDERTASGWNEVALRLDLRPGRYQLRLAAERRRTQTAGSVHATIIVPDFDGEALSLSGVVIGQGSGRPLAGREAVADVLPFEPTAARDWNRGDRVGALLRIHQARRPPARPVVLQTQIIDASGGAIHESTRTIDPGEFAEGAAAEHRFDLPLSALAPGHYLLRFVASAGDARVQRDVRFSYGLTATSGDALMQRVSW